MRVLVWAIAAGLALGALIGWWSLQRDRAAAAPAAAVPAAAADTKTNAAPIPGPTLYRWRDDAGTLHITDQAPPGRPYEVVKLRDDQNVVSMSGPAPEPESEAPLAD